MSLSLRSASARHGHLVQLNRCANNRQRFPLVYSWTKDIQWNALVKCHGQLDCRVHLVFLGPQTQVWVVHIHPKVDSSTLFPEFLLMCSSQFFWWRQYESDLCKSLLGASTIRNHVATFLVPVKIDRVGEVFAVPRRWLKFDFLATIFGSVGNRRSSARKVSLSDFVLCLFRVACSIENQKRGTAGQKVTLCPCSGWRGGADTNQQVGVGEPPSTERGGATCQHNAAHRETREFSPPPKKKIRKPSQICLAREVQSQQDLSLCGTYVCSVVRQWLVFPHLPIALHTGRRLRRVRNCLRQTGPMRKVRLTQVTEKTSPSLWKIGRTFQAKDWRGYLNVSAEISWNGTFSGRHNLCGCHVDAEINSLTVISFSLTIYSRQISWPEMFDEFCFVSITVIAYSDSIKPSNHSTIKLHTAQIWRRSLLVRGDWLLSQLLMLSLPQLHSVMSSSSSSRFGRMPQRRCVCVL